MADVSDEWIAFEAAGRLIDGPSGWAYDSATRKRPRAEALLAFACKGVVKTRAVDWTILKEDAPEIEASGEDRTAFLQMLLHRFKWRKERFDFNLPNYPKMSVGFEIADDINGHYEVSSFETHYTGSRVRPQLYRVTALRFAVADIRSLFQVTELPPIKTDSRQTSKGGRPTVADWEGAALEMARRFYVGDLKPDRVADVEKQLTIWLAEQDVHPSSTTVREHAKRYFDAFAAW